MEKYLAYFRQTFDLKTIKVVNQINIQTCGAEKEDIFCQTWGLWYLFQRFWIGRSPEQIRDTLKQMSSQLRQAMIQEFYHNLRADFPAIKKPMKPDPQQQLPATFQMFKLSF